MPLTQEKAVENNNDHNYLHKKFKKMASTVTAFPSFTTKLAESSLKVSNVNIINDTSITNGSIAAAHPEIEKIKNHKEIITHIPLKNVQINFNEKYRLSNVNCIVQSGQTSFNDEFLNKTEDKLEHDFIKDGQNGGTCGRYVCPYCKLSCAKPSVLQKHIRAHTNERPYPCEPCGFAFKTKSNLYKHRRSRTHTLRLQGADVSSFANEEELSGDSESDTSSPSTSVYDTGSERSLKRIDILRTTDMTSPDLNERTSSPFNINLPDIPKYKSIYKPKFRATLYQDNENKDKLKRSIPSNADFLTEHISKIISDNEAIVDVTDTPLQKKYGKIKQIADSKLSSTISEIKTETTPLNLTKSKNENENFRKRSHTDSFQIDYQKHPLNPEGSIIKDLLLKTKNNGVSSVITETIDGNEPLFICSVCQIFFRSANNLETHRLNYCRGNGQNNILTLNSGQKDLKKVRPDSIYHRSNSINVKLPENHINVMPKLSPIIQSQSPPLRNSPIKQKPEQIIIIKTECTDVIAPLPSPGPLLGNTRLVDTRKPSESMKKQESFKHKLTISPKRQYYDNLSDPYSPRSNEELNCRTDIFTKSRNGCDSPLRLMEDIPLHLRNNSTSLQMFGGEVKIVDHSGSTTTLRIEPSKNQLSPILVHQSISPSKLMNDSESSSVVVRSGLHSGGTIVHNPPTPKEITISQPQTARVSISNLQGVTNMMSHSNITHFQFPPLSAITAFNPLTLPPLSPSLSPNGATTILHGGKLIPHVPGIPGPNTPVSVISSNQSIRVNTTNSDVRKHDIEHDIAKCNILSTNLINKKGQIKKNEIVEVTRNVDFKTNTDHRRSKYQLSASPQNYNAPLSTGKNIEESKPLSQTLLPTNKLEAGVKRNSEGLPKTNKVKEKTLVVCNKAKIYDKIPTIKTHDAESIIINYNFENLITKAEIYNNHTVSTTDISKNTNTIEVSTSNERSEPLYFQKNAAKPAAEERKPNFLRPSTLPLKPGTFTPKRHHGITPNANTLPLVSPETPRPAKAYGQLYLNGNAYTYLGLKCSTKVFYCTINRPQPTYVPNQHFLSMYSNWQLLSELTPDPLGLSTSTAMSLYDSRHRPQNVTICSIKQDFILTHSSQWNQHKDKKESATFNEHKRNEDAKNPMTDCINSKKELAGGFESNEEYTYVRGRGRGRYVCSECGIRCKKPSMLKKHIRTHTDVRPFTCVHCAFSFKTKGNLTKHMKSKAHYKKCCELGINPNEGNDLEFGEAPHGSGETDDETDTDGEEGETESSDTEVYKSRLPEHEAAHCLLSLGGSRQTNTETPGLTSARPSTYPYAPIGQENTKFEINISNMHLSIDASSENKNEMDNEPMDLSKADTKMIDTSISEIPTAGESSVLASLASNTAKLPQQQAHWSNGEPMLQTYLTERALLDSKIKLSQVTTSKPRKVELDKPIFVDSKRMDSTKTVSVMSTISSVVITTSSTQQATEEIIKPKLECPSELPVATSHETKRSRTTSNQNAENAKQVVSEYLKHARVNMNSEDLSMNQFDNKSGNALGTSIVDDDELSGSEQDKMLPSLEHDAVARKVVIGAGGVAFKVTKRKEFDSGSYSTGSLMEDGRRVCDFCNKTFTKPSQLRLHLNIHYMERPFRCSACAVSFRTRGHLQKHERSGSHHNKVSMTSTFGAATSLNPRPFRCSDCNIAFRIHGHLAKHLRSKMHVMRLECLFKLPFGTFTEIERAGVSLTDIDTTDCASSLASLQSLARKLHEQDPTKLEYREPSSTALMSPVVSKEVYDEEDLLQPAESSESDKDTDVKSYSGKGFMECEKSFNSATDN